MRFSVSLWKWLWSHLCLCVLNPKVLVVQEKTGRFKGQGIWKFPTGVVNEGEYIHDGSVREVKEETGVSLSTFLHFLHWDPRANPHSLIIMFFFRWIQSLSKYWLSGSISKTTTILCLYCNNITESCLFLNLGRQTHKAFFEKSDLFFVCMMKPLSLEINAQESEIEAAQVTPFQWLSSTSKTLTNLFSFCSGCHGRNTTSNHSYRTMSC